MAKILLFLYPFPKNSTTHITIIMNLPKTFSRVELKTTLMYFISRSGSHGTCCQIPSCQHGEKWKRRGVEGKKQLGKLLWLNYHLVTSIKAETTSNLMQQTCSAWEAAAYAQLSRCQFGQFRSELNYKKCLWALWNFW